MRKNKVKTIEEVEKDEIIKSDEPDETIENISSVTEPVVEVDKCTKLNPKVKLYVVIGLIAAVILGISIGFLFSFSASYFANKSVSVTNDPPVIETTSTTDAQLDTNSGPPNFSTAVNLTDKYKGNNDLLVSAWETSPKMLSRAESDKILKQVDPDNKYVENFKKIAGIVNGANEGSMFEGSTSVVEADYLILFKAGIFDKKSAFAGKQLYYWFSPALSEGPGPGHIRFLVFVDDQNKMISVPNPTDASSVTGEYPADQFGLIFGYIEHDYKMSTTESFDLKDIKSSQTLSLGWSSWPTIDSSYMSDYVPYDNALGIRSITNLLSEKSDDRKQALNPILNASDIISKTNPNIVFSYKDGCYRQNLANGAQVLYHSYPVFATPLVKGDGGPFMQISQVELSMNINWERKENTKDTYRYYLQVGGCGKGLPCTAVVDNESWFNPNDLVEIGKSKDGQSVYELQDKANNEYYKNLFKTEVAYEDGVLAVNEQGELTEAQKFQKFLDDQPIFFWQDPMDHWYAFKKNKYNPMAECGKPVIYLYPEKTTKVNVQVKPNGGFSKTEPSYLANGWDVLATPDSQLFNYADKTTYPYLFWEGHAYNMSMPTEGFVMKKSDVGTKMNILLSKLGLNAKEIKDFMEFWQPKLEVKPYVFVTFVSQTEFDKLAPLTITPAPDKVIRVFMDYAPLDQPVNVRPMKIITPVRTGFTVVEWGGRLHK